VILCASPFFMRWMLRSKRIGKYAWCFLNSSKILDVRSTRKGDIIKYLGGVPQAKNGVLFIDHGYRLERELSFEIGTDRLFLLNDWRVGGHPVNVPMLNPHYFYPVCEHAPAKLGKKIFITVGNVAENTRNLSLLYDVAKAFGNQNRFEIWCIGRVSEGGDRLNVPSAIKLLGRLSYADMFSRLEMCDYFIPLLDPDVEALQMYFNGTTTGSKQLILGFHLVPIIHERFAEVYHFSPDDSIIYPRGAFREAFLTALQLSDEEWLKKRDRLAAHAARVYQKSLQNLKEKLEGLAGEGVQ